MRAALRWQLTGYGLAIAALAALIWIWSSCYVLKPDERGVVPRLGRIQRELQKPGLAMILWPIESLVRVSIAPQTVTIEAQELVARGDAAVKAGASCRFRVADVVQVISEIHDSRYAIGELTKQAMQQQAGQFAVEDFLYRPEMVGDRVKDSMVKSASEWGLEVLSLELKIEAH